MILRASIVVSLVLIGSAAGPARQLHRHEALRMSMACAYVIEAYGSDAGALPRIVEEAFDEVDRIDRLMSHYKPESPLSHVNREAARQPVRVDAELFDFIATALRYTRESDGAFDVTVGPLMKAWGFFRGEGHMPTDGQLEAARRLVGPHHVALNHSDRTITFDMPGVELDLGGIAKGYAVDRAARLLRQRGIAAALISAGGSTIYGLGAPPGRTGLGCGHSGSRRPGQGRPDRAVDQPRAVGGGQRREVVRGGWHPLFAHHGSRAPAGRCKASSALRS